MMIEVITIQLPEHLTKDDVLENYRETTKNWAKIPELIRKHYIYDEVRRLGGGIYHWQDEAAADYWHGAEWCEVVKSIYGHYPDIRRFDVPIVVDNVAKKIID